MTVATLSLGSNVGDRLAHLHGGVAALRSWLRAVSPVYETASWGPVPQGDYLNAVVVVDDPQARPRDWLDRAHAAESAAGRTREVRYGPRTLDVDVLSVDDVRSDDPVLTLPHPRVAERSFVLVPWADCDPNAEVPGVGRVARLLAARPVAEVAGVRRTELELV